MTESGGLLQRKRLLSLVVSQALSVCGSGALAADIPVDDLTSATGGPGCSLRDAIAAANGDLAVAGCAAGSGFDRILLPSNSDLVLSVIDNDINCLPVITSNVTIDGAGSTIRRAAGAPPCRLLEVDGSLPPASLNLETVTLSNGLVSGGGSSLDGGAVLSRGASVTLRDTVISDSAAQNGGGIAISGGTLVMQDSTITGNIADQSGGGLYSGVPAFMYAYSTAITGNSAPIGGGAFVHASTMPRDGERTTPVLDSLRLDGAMTPILETARNRGLYISLLMDSTVSGNTATDSNQQGHGLRYSAGGGIHVDSGLLYLQESLVENNHADVLGGGVSASYGAVITLASTISGNTSGYLGGGVGLSYGYQIGVRSNISYNQALVGGGVGAIDSVNILLKSTISGNHAMSGVAPKSFRGGFAVGTGGGLFGQGSILSIGDSTVSGNIAAGDAGAMAWNKYLQPANAEIANQLRSPLGKNRKAEPQPVEPLGSKYLIDIRHSTIAFNRTTGAEPGALTAVQLGAGGDAGLLNAIVSNPGIGDCRSLDGNPPINQSSLTRDGSCGASLSGDPRLGPLANNGSLTLSHGLAADSPALNAGDPVICASTFDSTDQNGVPRPSDGVSTCSIGSTQGVGVFGGVAQAVPTLAALSQALLALLLAVAAWMGIRPSGRGGSRTMGGP